MYRKKFVVIALFMLVVINCLSGVIYARQQEPSISYGLHDDVKRLRVPSDIVADEKTIDGDLVIMKTNEIIDSLVLSGYHVKGDVIVKLSNCVSSTKSAPRINFTGMWVEGDIYFEWPGPDPIEVRIFSNPIVYGNISVYIHDVHSLDEENGVTVEIYDNGENMQDPHKNQAVGNIFVSLVSNFCMPMEVGVTHNWVHNTIQVNVTPANQVNTFTLGILENHVGDYIHFKFEGNDVDRVFTSNINDNTIGERLEIFIQNNPHFGWIEVACPCIVYTYVEDNHCVEKNTGSQIWISSNHQYGIPFYNTIRNNGFGGDLYIYIVGNTDLMPGDMQNKFENNKVDQQMTITVSANGGYTVRDYAIDNKAADAAPELTLQGPVQVSGNAMEDQQTIAGDADHDGLTDAYEKMIGTDPNINDTDLDGFLDGWDDRNGNGMWDGGSGTLSDPAEKYGEVGDPIQEVDVYKHRGSISTLFYSDDDNANPINKDIYVEVDFLDGCVVASSVLKPVKTIFAKHCIHLHVDMGWSTGPAGGQTGGDVIPNAGWVHGGNNYLYFDTYGVRRRTLPLPVFKNDFYDMKLGLTTNQPRGYFFGGMRGMREDIFHYVLVVHYYARRNMATGGIEYRPNAYGVGEFGRSANLGDDFVICYDNHLVGGVFDTAEFCDTFMHELGHNLELHHSWEGGDPPAGNDPDPAVNPMGTETVRDTVMYWSGGNKLDYLRMEWERINLASVIDGTRILFS